MKTKEETIKEAWGEDYNKYNPDENGWSKLLIYGDFRNNKFDKFDSSGRKIYNIRPKSLQGIETNNGWTKIESESDLPKDINNLWLIANDGSIILGQWCIFQKIFKTTYGNNFDTDGVYFTHYQPIKKPEPPLH